VGHQVWYSASDTPGSGLWFLNGLKPSFPAYHELYSASETPGSTDSTDGALQPEVSPTSLHKAPHLSADRLNQQVATREYATQLCLSSRSRTLPPSPASTQRHKCEEHCSENNAPLYFIFVCADSPDGRLCCDGVIQGSGCAVSKLARGAPALEAMCERTVASHWSTHYANPSTIY
jgi:hypothetical protein